MTPQNTQQTFWQKITALPLKMKVGIIAAILLLLIASGVAAFFLLQSTQQKPAADKTQESPQANKETAKKETTDTKTEDKKPDPEAPKPSNPGTTTKPSNGGSAGSTTPPPSGGTTPGGGTTPPPPTSSRPNASNTGVPAGTSLSTYSGGANNNTSNATFENLDFPSTPGGYIFSGSNITLRNCYIRSGLLLQGDNITVEHCTIEEGASFSGTNTVSFQYNNVKNFSDDGLHVTSDSGQVMNVTIANNYVHTPTPTCGAHADGMQVRGVNGLTLTNNAIDMGPWAQVCGQDALNAAVFLESANGGNTNMTFTGNYLNGAGITLRLTPGANQKFVNNRFGRDYHYGLVLNNTNSGDITQLSGNVMDDDGSAVGF